MGGAVPVFKHGQPPGFVIDPAVFVSQLKQPFGDWQSSPSARTRSWTTFHANSKQNSNRWMAASLVRSVAGALSASLKRVMALAKLSSLAVISEFHNEESPV